jgi:hypothetical protein
VNPGGVCIGLLAVWLGCQVFGGQALERLGVVKPKAAG